MATWIYFGQQFRITLENPIIRVAQGVAGRDPPSSEIPGNKEMELLSRRWPSLATKRAIINTEI